MMKNTKTTNTSRRLFMKKVAYATPAVVALGVLGAPTNANASYVHVAQVNNFSKHRTADVSQQNDGTKWVKTYENDVVVQNETNIFKSKNPFMDWLRSFFS